MTTTPASSDEPAPQPYYHADSGAVRFWVSTGDGTYVGASITTSTLHYRFNVEVGDANAVSIYSAHRSEIDDAVERRVAAGSIEPVMLREHDLSAPRRP
jgi:hypothetical protein